MNRKAYRNIVVITQKIIKVFAYGGISLFVLLSLYFAATFGKIYYYESTASLRNEYAINYINREQQRHFHDNQEFFNQTKLSELSLEEHRPYYDYFVGLESDKAYVYSIAKYKYDRKKILGIDIGI
ncbi:MAG: hypothetical protein AAFO95_01480, partial [Cyanobacteria bacterium J06600_6]